MNNSELDLKELIGSYLKHWKWFALSVVVFGLLAYAYLRYTVPQYSASAKIQILEDKNATSELSMLQDLDIFSKGGNTKMEDEIELLKARENFIQVVKKLKLNVQYFVLGNIRDSEIYGTEFPFNINFISADSIVNKSKHTFYVDLDSDTSFQYGEEEDVPFKQYDFGTKIQTKIGNIILLPNAGSLNKYKGKRLMVVISPLPEVVGSFRDNIVLTSAEKSNIISLSLTDPNQKRAIDVIDELILTNNENAVADKKAIADRTTKFINDRITEIYSNLSTVDESAESFKESRGIADLGSQSNVNFNQSAASEQQLQEASIQLNIANSMQDLIKDQDGYDIIPTNVGLNDAGISNAAQRYNELVAQRNRLLESSNEKNPVIVKLDQQLESLRRGMQSSLNNVTNNLDLQVNSLSKQLSQINSRIYAAPSNERALRDISRKQQTTESLYLYLLQKREESQITFASAAPKSKIVDSAYGSGLPISPNRKIVFLSAMIVGLLIPFSIIYVKDSLNNKIQNKVELEKLISNTSATQVLAELPAVGKKDSKLITGDDRSVLGESLRILRTNLDYLLKRKPTSLGSVVLITSSVSGEGKTFVSSNLSTVLASTKKKVLLVGADIRNPKLHDFYKNLDKGGKQMKSRDYVGLTEYLYNDEVEVKSIITPTLLAENKIDIVFSGKIPPNPAELLMSDRLETFFEYARKHYDYIIVDSAPMIAVTDTLLISHNADQILYVTKAGFTERKVLEYPVKLVEEDKIKNMSFIVNGVKESNLGYGGKYGYGYGKTVKKWWKFA